MRTAGLDPRPAARVTAAGQPQLGSGFLAAWALAYAVGEALGLGSLGLLFSYSQAAGPGARVILALTAGALEGLIVGSLLGLVLRAVRPQLRLGAWVAATMAGAVVGWALGSMVSLLMQRQPAVGWVAVGWVLAGAVLLGICAGPILVLFQQRVLRDLHRAFSGGKVAA